VSMIEQQLKEIRDMAGVLYDEKRYAAQKVMCQAADTIEALSAKLAAANMERSDRYYGGGWIACEDRLPEKNKPVLCWVISTTIAGGETYIIGLCDNGFWFLKTYEIGGYSFPTRDYKVVAWQPLPEPYRP